MNAKYEKLAGMLGLIAFAICIICCAAGNKGPQVGNAMLKPGIDLKDYKKVAVTGIQGLDSSLAVELSDIIGIELMKRGFDVSERGRLKALKEEKKITQEDDLAMGRLLEVDAIVTGTIQEHKHSYYDSEGRHRTYWTTSMTLKMLDTVTGSVLWTATGKEDAGARYSAPTLLPVLFDTLIKLNKES